MTFELTSPDVRHFAHNGATILFSAAALLLPLAAQAETDFTPNFMAGGVHHGNVFALPPGDQRVPIDGGAPARADTLLSGGLGLNAKVSFGDQAFAVTGFGVRTTYDKFSELDHNEYGADGVFSWKLARRFDGQLGYNVQQRMVPFADTQESATSLLLENLRDVYGGVNVELATKWRLDSEGRYSRQKSPRPGAPDLEIEQSSANSEVKYLGPGRLTFGLGATLAKGTASGLQAINDEDFEQRSGYLSAGYEVSGHSSFQGNVGYTTRDNLQTNDVDGFTGQLTYNRALSGKSSMVLQADRTIASYLIDTTVQTEFSSGITIGGTWQLTPKTGFTLQLMRRHSSFPGAPMYPGGPNRADDYSALAFDMNWQATRRLFIRPYLRLEDRDSNNPQLSFKDKVVGLEVFVGAEKWTDFLRQFARQD